MTVYASKTPVFREGEKAFRFHTESHRSIEGYKNNPPPRGIKSNDKSMVAKVDRSKQKAFSSSFS